MTDVFRLLGLMKNLNKQELLFTKEDELILRHYYNVYHLYNKMSYKLWEKVVKEYSIERGIDINIGAEELVPIIKNYVN